MSSGVTPEIAAAYGFCRAVAKREAKNFYYAFRVLPRHKSDAMCAIYAFMRKADDLADDESVPVAERREAMAAWTASWKDSRLQGSGDLVFLAVRDAQERFGISDGLLEQLVAGTTMDLQEELPGVGHVTIDVIAMDGENKSFEADVYDTFEHLYRYCYLVASVVGLVTIRIFGYSDPDAELLAEKTGVAFQLTNILRDVKEDAERGRIYLPRDDMRRAETGEGELAAALGAGLDGGLGGGRPSPGLLRLLQMEIDRAEEYYGSGDRLIPLLDADSRPAMRVLLDIYHGLLRRIAADPAAVFRERVSVPTPTKLAILGRGLLASLASRGK